VGTSGVSVYLVDDRRDCTWKKTPWAGFPLISRELRRTSFDILIRGLHGIFYSCKCSNLIPSGELTSPSGDPI
jgi:hypothetical protein